jgi:hypothetical protein
MKSAFWVLATGLVVLTAGAALAQPAPSAQPPSPQPAPQATPPAPAPVPAAAAEAPPEEAAAPADAPVAPLADVPPPAPTPAPVLRDAPPAASVAASVPTEKKLKGWSTKGAILQEDVEPSVTALHADGLDVKLGALTQVHLAPLVGSDALISNGDAASEPGFRIRRARLGIEASFEHNLGAFLNLDLLASNSTDGIVSDAKLTWSPEDYLRVAVGSGKVPFSRSSLLSSRRLPTIERPVAVGAIAPARRLGITAEGSVLWERLSYLVGVMNGTDGFGAGNQFGGLLGGARLEGRVFGRADARDPAANGVTLGAGILYDNGPATDTVSWSADLYAALFSASLTAEVLCSTITPDDAPLVAPTVADDVKRCGVYGELGYTWAAPSIDFCRSARRAPRGVRR